MLEKHALLGATAVALVSVAGVANAQQTATVSEVQVTARTLEDTLPEQLARTGTKVEVIQGQAIRNGAYTDVAGALQALAPSLYVLPKNGPFDYVDVSLLGSRSADVLWLVDGVRINNRLYASTLPLDTIPAGMVDHIEVLDGGQALFYGTQAIAGAVNVVTRPFTDRLAGGLTLQGDSNGARHVDAAASNKLGMGQGVVFGAYDKSDGYKAFRDQDYQPSATHRKRGYDVWTLGGKYGLDLSDQARLNASYQHTDGKADNALPFKVAKNVNKRVEDLASLKLDYQVAPRLGLFVKGYYHNWSTHYDTVYNSLVTPGTQDVLYDNAFWGYHDLGVNALGKYDVAQGLEAYFGYDFQAYGGRDEVLVIKQTDERTHAVFGQLRFAPQGLEGLNLAAGFRHNMPSVGQSATIWNVSGRYESATGFYVKGEAGTNFRLPSAEELFADDPQDERGNPRLRPERSLGGELTGGIKWRGGDWRMRAELTGFARDVTDLIDYDDFDAATGQSIFGNVAGTVRVRGAQVSLNADSEAIGASLSYVANSSKQDGGGQIDRIPQSQIKGGLDWHPANLPVGATLSVFYSGQVQSSVGASKVQYGDYTVADLSGRWFLDGARHHRLNLSIRNLFDQRYGLPRRGCADVPGDGPYDCSTPYTYVNLGLPRTVSVSYSYSF